MHITRNDKQRLVLVDFPFKIAIPLLFLTIVTGYVLLFSKSGWGGKCVFLAFILLGDAILLLLAKRSVWDFDLIERRLVWNQRNVYRKKGGVIPFDQIRGVTINILPGEEMSYRLVLSTGQETIPMMTSYAGHGRPSVAKKLGRIATVVNEALKTDPTSAMEKEILSLATAGRCLEAVQMARLRYGWDLNTAKKFVDSLMERVGSSS